MIQGATGKFVMDKAPGPNKSKTRGWTRYLSVITAVLLVIAVIIDPDTLSVSALICALVNVGVHYKDFLREKSKD